LIFEIGCPTPKNCKEFQHHDFIEFPLLSSEGISAKCTQLYQRGYSIREIAKELGVSKTRVLNKLTLAGVPLRPSNADYKKDSSRTPRSGVGNTPFGFARLRGKLVVDAKEIETLRLILQLWRSGKTFHAIAVHLNSHQIKPRKGKAWQFASVRSVIQHHKADLNRIEEIISWASTN